MEKIIIINNGSESKKYALYQGDEMIVSFHYEKNDDHYELNESFGDNIVRNFKVRDEDFERAFDYTVDKILKDGRIKVEEEIKSIVFRVVAPGTYFTKDRIVGEIFLEKLDDIFEHAPLHIRKIREELDQAHDRLPTAKLLGISDSCFHKTMPMKAKIYGIPKSMREDFDIYRFGYHGISISSVVKKAKIIFGEIPEKTIICHLGGGSSVTALINGQSIETTMGYSPLEGLPMATRVGNIGAGALMSLSDYVDLDLGKLRTLLSTQSGLKGISGGISDVRILIENLKKGDKDSKLALEHYVYQIKKQIGSLVAVLNGVDSLILTGTISERSSFIREMILSDLSFFGLKLDKKLNTGEINEYRFINEAGSSVSIIVIKTDEEKEMASRAMRILNY